MKLAGILVTALVVLAAAQAAATTLAVLLLAALIYGLVVSPRETASLLVFLAALSVFERHPLPCLGFVVVAITAKAITQRRP